MLTFIARSRSTTAIWPFRSGLTCVLPLLETGTPSCLSTTYFLAVDGQQLRPFVESLPTTEPDRSVMLGLLSMPGTRPVTCFRIPSEYGSGWIHNLKWKKSAVKALLVQSRKGKMVNDIGHNDNDLCENCESTQCGVGFAIPFLDCYMLEGIFNGKCGNSTFQDNLVF